jgi:hypothetical protein
MNQYTRTNPPPYPWVSVEDELPPQLIRVWAVWLLDNNKVPTIARSVYDGKWRTWEFAFDARDWHVSHWQYLPALPE